MLTDRNNSETVSKVLQLLIHNIHTCNLIYSCQLRLQSPVLLYENQLQDVHVELRYKLRSCTSITYIGV